MHPKKEAAQVFFSRMTLEHIHGKESFNALLDRPVYWHTTSSLVVLLRIMIAVKTIYRIIG